MTDSTAPLIRTMLAEAIKSDEKPTSAPWPHAYVFGYGSLMDSKSLRSTIGEPMFEPFIATIKGLKRTYLTGTRNNANFPKFWIQKRKNKNDIQSTPVFKGSYFDITIDKESATTAVLVPVTVEQLRKLVEREQLYEKQTISHLVDSDIWDEEHKPATVYAFFGKAEPRLRIFDTEAYMPEPYLEICAGAAKELGQAVYDNFVEQFVMMDCPVLKNIELGDNVTY